jgi:2-polyprenyl-6-methoxyphenol hydroxylase-like FAD-dependent oxidoreductase
VVPVTDVVVVGGGIGGASLAYALAVAGMGVTVLEASSTYEDRVRGESLQLWGVKEARELGVEAVMADAGARIAPVWKRYVEGFGDAGDIPMGMLMDGFDGTLNLHHPAACQALVDAAAAQGASVVRGVRDVKLWTGTDRGASYSARREVFDLKAQLIVGADGRTSTVRKQIGVTLERQAPISYIAGLLLDDIAEVPDVDVLCSAGDVFFLLFHQGNGRARAYAVVGLSGQHRFAGRDKTHRFLKACDLSCYPWSGHVVTARPAGPVATYPGDDTWTDAPYDDGVVLVGDAAGHNDPIAGQGLSIALRDARIVRDLVLDGARTADAFAAYGAERTSRMQRLRLAADLVAVAQAEDCDNRAARRMAFSERMAALDPEMMGLLMGLFIGPETIPAELVNDRVIAEIRAA